MKITLLLILVSVVGSYSCSKEQGPSETRRNFTATIMQNKLLINDLPRNGYFYVLQENESGAIRFQDFIAGFDSLYTEGYQYRVELSERCTSFKPTGLARQDVLNGCSINLVSIIEEIEVEGEYLLTDIN